MNCSEEAGEQADFEQNAEGTCYADDRQGEVRHNLREGYPGKMQCSGGERKTRHVFYTVHCFRHLTAVRVAVEEREHGNDRGTNCDWKVNCQRYQKSKRCDRGENSWLDEWHRNICHPERAADQHYADKNQRPNPERSTTLHSCPKTDGKHYGNMVEAAERMTEPGRERGGRAVSHVRDGGACNEQESRGDWNEPFHCCVLSMDGAVNGDELAAVWECGFDLDIVNHLGNALHHF